MPGGGIFRQHYQDSLIQQTFDLLVGGAWYAAANVNMGLPAQKCGTMRDGIIFANRIWWG